MRGRFNKAISLVLIVALLVGIVPMQYVSALGENISDLITSAKASGNDYNQDLVDELQAICSEGQDATQMLDTLYEYGMVDETGMPVFEEDYTLVEKGKTKKLTDEELVSLMKKRNEAGKEDEEITVDGATLTWGQLATLINTRDTVETLQKWMITGETFDENRMQMMDSLAAQLMNEGLTLDGIPQNAAKLQGDTTITGGSINHNATVSVSFAESTITSSSKTVTVNVNLNTAQTKDVTFDVQAVSGSGDLAVNQSSAVGDIIMSDAKDPDALGVSVYTITIPAGKQAGSFKVNYSQDSKERAGRRIATLQLSNIQNALFSGNKRAGTLIFTANSTTYNSSARKFGLNSDPNSFSKYSEVTKDNKDVSEDLTKLEIKGSDIIKAVKDDSTKKKGTWRYCVNYECYGYIASRWESDYYTNDIDLFITEHGTEHSTNISTSDRCKVLYYGINSTHINPYSYSSSDDFTKDKGYINQSWRTLNGTSGYINRDERFYGYVDNEKIFSTGNYNNGTVSVEGTFHSDDSSTSLGNFSIQGKLTLANDKAKETEQQPKANTYYKLYVSGTYIPDKIYPESVTIPNGNFYPGQQIPVTVKFSDCFKIDNSLVMTFTDGQTATPVENGDIGHSVTFMYTVKDNPTGSLAIKNLKATNGHFTDSSGENVYILDFDDNNNIIPLSDVEGSRTKPSNSSNRMTGFKDYSFTGLTAAIDDNKAGKQWVKVNLSLNSNMFENKDLGSGNIVKILGGWIGNGGTEIIDSDSFAEFDNVVPIETVKAAFNETYPDYKGYKIMSYINSMYISDDGGKTKYPLYVVVQGAEEVPVTLVSYYKPSLNLDGESTTKTLELFMNQNETIDYFASENKDKSAPVLLSSYFTSAANYDVKGGVLFEPGAAILTYPVNGNPYESDWSKLVSNQSDLVTYYADLSGEGNKYLFPTTGQIKYKVAGSSTETLNATCSGDKKITFIADEDNDLPAISGNSAIIPDTEVKVTKGFSPDQDTLCLQAKINNLNKYTFNDSANIVWISSDESIARINSKSHDLGTGILTAEIEPTGKCGRVHFSLYAKNGGLDGFTPVELCRSIDILCTTGETPILKIPTARNEEGELEKTILQTREGKELNVCFTANVASINKSIYDDYSSIFNEKPLQTTYTLKLYELDDSGKASGEPIKTIEVNAQNGDEVVEPGKIAIPGEYLTKVSSGDSSYKIVISAVSQSMNKSGQLVEKEMKAEAEIKVIANPESVTIERLSSYSYLNTDDITLNITVSQMSEDATGKVVVVDGDGRTVKTQNIKNGNNTLNLKNLSVPTGKLKQSYTVTATIEPGGQAAPAVDGCILSIYNSNALKILVDKVNKGNSITLDNHNKIKSMINSNGTINLDGTTVTLESLAKDINLSSLITINYGEYVWGQVSDQINWSARNLDENGNEIYNIISKDEDGNVIRKTSTEGLKAGDTEDKTFVTNTTLNYKQGDAYSNINSYDYVSYNPYVDLVASGLAEGKSRITAIHSATGMKKTLDITTVKLEDQLYMFQFYPKQETTMDYTNGKGKKCSVKSNSDGQLVLYEPDSIVDKINLHAENNGTQYIETVYVKDIETGERDSTKLQTYPVNHIKVRDVASVTLYMPGYEGKKFVIRGGVFKNGVYCEAAGFSDNYLTRKSGMEDQVLEVGSDAKVNLKFDSSEFYTPDEFGNKYDMLITGSDTLEYIFEIRFYENGDKSKKEVRVPLVVHVPATTDETNVARAGEKAVVIKKIEEYEAPVVNRQMLDLYYRNKDTKAISMDVTQSTNGVGISYQYPHAYINTEILMWGYPLKGDNGKSDEFDFYYNDPNEYKPEGQVSKDITYPFSTFPVVENIWNVTKDGVENWVSSGHSSDLIQNFIVNGLPRKTVSNAWEFSNTTDVDPNKDEGKQNAEKNALEAVSSQLDPGTVLGSMESQSDNKTGKAFAVLGKLTSSLGLPVNIVVTPTEDCRTFRAVVTIERKSFDLLDSDEEDAPSQTTENGGESNTTNEADIKKAEEDAKNADPFTIELGKQAELGISGYVIGDITYSEDKGTWIFVFVAGGFNAELGFEVEWNANFMVGPVPATTSFKINVDIGLEIGFAITYYGENKGNDFLIIIGVTATVEAYAGIGFDVGILAFKLGIMGTISVTDEFRTLLLVSWKNGGSLDPHVGNMVFVEGSIGLKFAVKVLGFEYETTFASVGWNKEWKQGHYDYIGTYWDNRKAGESTEDISYENETIEGGLIYDYPLKDKVQLQSEEIDENTMLYALSECIVESRDYLYYGESEWNDEREFSLFGIDETNKVKNLLYNAYPYAEPSYNTDGSIVVYLSDASSADAIDTVASYAVKTGTEASNTYEDKQGISPITYVNDVLNNTTHKPLSDGEKDGLDPVYYPLTADKDLAGKLINPKRQDGRTGYGDSNLTASGTKDFTAAVWIRQTADIGKKSGEEAKNVDLTKSMNGTEIYASIYENGNWKTEALTSNNSPDVAPCVAAKNGKAVVAWRSVVASDPSDPLNYNTMDNLLYRVYENGKWGKPVMIYNNETGTIDGITADIDDNGNVVLAYGIKTGDDTETKSCSEVMYSYINNTGEITNVRVTNDDDYDGNVDVKAVNWQNENQFILAWYNSDVEESYGDIRFLALHGNTGLPNADMVEKASTAGAEGITNNFKLSAPATNATLDNLSVIWQESVNCNAPFAQKITTITEDGNEIEYYNSDGAKFEPTSEELKKAEDIWPTMVREGENLYGQKTVTESYSATSYSTLQAVKFYDYKEGYITTVAVTSPIEVATMETGQKIDSFSAYNDGDGTHMYAVLQSSDYNTMKLGDENTYKKEEIIQEYEEVDTGNIIEKKNYIYTPIERTDMMTATGIYTDCEFDVEAKFNEDDIVRMYRMPISLVVTNNGTSTLTKETIKIGDNASKELNEEILPGTSKTLTVYYDLPNDKIKDVKYTVKATSKNNNDKSFKGELNLFRPEVEIRNAKVTEAKEGTRTVSMTLNNSTDIPLAGTENTVQLEVYNNDNDRKEGKAVLSKTFSGDKELGLIDAGACLVDMTLTKPQMDKLLKIQYNDFDPKNDEIPSMGATIYLRAWIKDKDGNVLQTLDEEGDVEWTNLGISNDAEVKTYSLVDNNSEHKATISTNIVFPEDENADYIAEAVEVIKNTSYCETTENANVIAVLVDKNGNIISNPKQTYDTENKDGLVTVGPETTKVVKIRFTKSDLLEGKTESDVGSGGVYYSEIMTEALDEPEDTISTYYQSGELDRFSVTGQLADYEELLNSSEYKKKYIPVNEDGAKGIVEYIYEGEWDLDTSRLETEILTISKNPNDKISIKVNGKDYEVANDKKTTINSIPILLLKKGLNNIELVVESGTYYAYYIAESEEAKKGPFAADTEEVSAESDSWTELELIDGKYVYKDDPDKEYKGDTNDVIKVPQKNRRVMTFKLGEKKDNRQNVVVSLDSGVIYKSLVDAVSEDSGTNFKLLDNIEDSVSIPKNKDIKLDLNGYKISGNITLSGKITIYDSNSNNLTPENIIGMGGITGMLLGNTSNIRIESGIFQEDLDLSDMLEKGSAQYLIGDKQVVLPNEDGLEFELSYEICDEDGKTVIKDVVGDSDPDIVVGKEYTAKVYLKTQVDSAVVNSFDFTALYDPEKISVSNADNGNNKYIDMTENVKGKMNYTLSAGSYSKAELDANPVATFNFVVKPEAVKVGDEVSLGFKKGATVSTENTINAISVSKSLGVKASIINEKDGVKVIDYRYAPEGYALAVIAKEHGKDKTISWKENQLFYTTNETYMELSTNPKGKDIEGVYLGLVELDSYNEDNDDQMSYDEIAAKVYKEIDFVETGKGKIIDLDDQYTGDIDDNGIVEANDASLVYQMLRNSGGICDYKPNVSSYTRLGALQRIISESDRDGRIYGTIEDVNDILNKANKNKK